MQKMSSGSQSNGGIFSTKKGGFFGGGSKTPTTSRPATSSGPTKGNSAASDTSPSQEFPTLRPGLVSRKPSFTLSSRSTNSKVSQQSRTNSGGISNNTTASSEKRTGSTKNKSKPPLSLQSGEKSLIDSYSQPVNTLSGADTTAASFAIDRGSVSSTAPFSSMLSAPMGNGYRPGTSYSQNLGTNGTLGPIFTPHGAGLGPMSPTLEAITYQHIQDMAVKRISTLDYLRKAHEGRVYWFNTLLFSKADISKMPQFEARRLARRATNYLLLGLSLPTIIDLNSSNALEFLRTLNALLTEFESFQQIHPPDGSSSSLSRARIPQMFKRAGTGGKGRRASNAADFGFEGHDMKSNMSSNGSTTSFPSSENDLLPGEEYTHLQTPSLPFDPDFYETFATLCDVLIDCYTKLMSLVPSPKECGPVVAEAFTKVDARVRKIIVQGIVKEFEDASRTGVKAEVASVGKVVLGGFLM